jgi:hypothetical protein
MAICRMIPTYFRQNTDSFATLKCSPSKGKNIGKRGFCTFLRPKRADFDESLPFKIRYFRGKGNGIIMLYVDNQLVTLNDDIQAFRRSASLLHVSVHLIIYISY